ncbi:MAG: prolyl oligopeptidase family serine peptidase, partial [Kangiellaceae bacterium]|nr:prolyl oligopeptidase family serine peptidase [Kangiellaceae bacterium]
PEAKGIYIERSPIHHTDQLSCPILLLQGADDKVVPPNQAEMMVEALEAKKIPYSYLLFEGEGHGFRNAETIIKAFEAELYFYRKILKVESEESIAEIDIKNLN